MMDFESQKAEDVLLRKYRTRGKPPFAGQPHLNLNTP